MQKSMEFIAQTSKLFRSAKLFYPLQHNYNILFCRNSTSISPVLLKKIEQLGKEKTEKLKELKAKYGSLSVGEYTVNSVIGGMRNLQAVLTETSHVDVDGVKFRGYSILDLQKLLIKNYGADEVLPEGLLWLLLTGELPTEKEVDIIHNELLRRMKSMSKHVYTVLDNMPKETHPMTLYIMGITSMQPQSVFHSLYKQRMLKKSIYWQHILDDCLSLIAALPAVAAYIYRRCFKDGAIPEPDFNLDWAANLSQMMGYTSPVHFDLMRLYLTIHADHDGGNISAHACHLVGSGLADPYLSFAASMAGLAGPLHGLANEECLKWLLATQKKLGGKKPTEENITEIAKETLASGQVIPGYGHAVLRKIDPRFVAQREFAEKHIANDDLYDLLKICTKVIPEILISTGKVTNPYPNVDCHSGVLLKHFGITEYQFYTVLFGVSRSIGISSQLVWSRLLGLPIERPGSISIDMLLNNCKKLTQK